VNLLAASRRPKPELTSPSALVSCVLAAVTNNNEALLFEPEKNAYKGVWKEVSIVDSSESALDESLPLSQSFDLTSHLIKLIFTGMRRLSTHGNDVADQLHHRGRLGTC
jgi:hypothetical protein